MKKKQRSTRPASAKAAIANVADGTYSAVVRSGMFTQREGTKDSLMLILDVLGTRGVFTALYTTSLDGIEGLSDAFAHGRDFLVCCDPSELTGQGCNVVVRGMVGDYARVAAVEPSAHTIKGRRAVVNLVRDLDDLHIETFALASFARLSPAMRRRIVLDLLATTASSRVVRKV